MGEHMELRDYQQEAVKTIDSLPDGARSICCLATGLGKTVVGANIESRGRVLWISHRDELVRQPERYFSEKNRTFGIEKAETHAGDEEVVSASIQTLSRDSRLRNYKPDDFDIIICDEAHHAAAQSYRKVLSYFHPRKLIGLTATPKRGDSVRLTDVFDSICFTRDLRWGIENGYLSRIRCVRVEASYDMTKLKKIMGDFTISGLESEMKRSNADMTVTKAYLDYCLPYGRQTLIYCPTAEICALTLRTMKKALPEDKKDTVEMLLDSTSKEERKRILDDYKSGKIKAIVNCMILTEGTDLPNTSCIINNRPTANDSLYQQIIGRGTRLYEGKEYCLIIDVEGHNARKRSVCTAPTLFGIDPDRLPGGVREMINEKTDLLDFSDDLIEKRASVAKNMELRRYVLNTTFDDYMSIIKKNADRGCLAIANAYRQNEEDKMDSDELDMGDIYARKMFDDDHYLRIRATFNGLIFLSRPDILGNTVIDCYIPPAETIDKKEISFVSGLIPMEKARDIVEKILRYMISPYYKGSWSKKERERLKNINCTGKQWGFICHEYEEYCSRPGRLSMLDANDLIELKKDMAEITARKNLLMLEEKGEYVPYGKGNTEEEDEENRKKLEALLKNINDRIEKEKRVIEEAEKEKLFRYRPDRYNTRDIQPMTEKQESYINSLFQKMTERRITSDRDFMFRPSEWSRGKAGILIGYLKAVTDNLRPPTDESYWIEIDLTGTAADIKSMRGPHIDSRYKIVQKKS